MKKINSIGYADKIIGLAILFLVAIPILLYLVNLLLNMPILVILMKVSLSYGGLILIFLTVLLMIEFHQDKKLNKHFEDNKNVKLPLENGLYECQACGYRQVKHEQKNCIVCGIHFKI